MQIVDNKALVLRTRNPDKYKVIPRMAVVGESEGVYEVAVKWGLDEVAVLTELRRSGCALSHHCPIQLARSVQANGAPD
jgi:hypothetical protein